MFRYLLKRILWAIPTLLLASLLFFGLNHCATDREQSFVSSDAPEAYLTLRGQAAEAKRQAAEVRADLPLFYFALTTAAQPDTLYRIFPISVRKRLSRWCDETGQWPLIQEYYNTLVDLVDESRQLPDSLPGVAAFQRAALELLAVEERDSLPYYAQKLADCHAQLASKIPNPQSEIPNPQSKIAIALHQAPPSQQRWIPALHWYGLQNQYHQWLSGFLRGDLGVSKHSHKPVSEALRLALWTTLFLNGCGLLLAYLIAVPLGVALARRRGRRFDRWGQIALLLLYAMPGFWLGGLLILFFATPGYGQHLIPGVGIEKYAGSGLSLLQWSLYNLSQFVLPIAVVALHALASIALQMRGAMLEVLEQDYIRTARAKGLPENAVYWRHAFRNALFPIITLLGSSLPGIIAGSLVVDYLFELPGMGYKTHEAFLSGDIPVLAAILMLLATLTVAGQLLSDLLYRWADPRVRLEGG